MPIFSYQCVCCGLETEDIVGSYKVESITCPECGCVAEKMFPNTMRFELRYDPKKDLISWGNEGYQRTRRYEEQDKLAKKNIFDQAVAHGNSG